MYWTGGRPRSTRSALTMAKICSGAGSAASDDSDTLMGPTPSWARPALTSVSQSAPAGAMLPGGLAGGKIPAAPATPPGRPTAAPLQTRATIGTSSVAARRRARCTMSSPLSTPLPRVGIGKNRQWIERVRRPRIADAPPLPRRPGASDAQRARGFARASRRCHPGRARCQCCVCVVPGAIGGAIGGTTRRGARHPRGRPRTRSATMLRWISEVPPAMVPENDRRYCTTQAPS